jgi:hypothetical protein
MDHRGQCVRAKLSDVASRGGWIRFIRSKNWEEGSSVYATLLFPWCPLMRGVFVPSSADILSFSYLFKLGNRSTKCQRAYERTTRTDDLTGSDFK